MSYQNNSLTAITDVPALVGAFAASIGFETDLTVPTQPIIRNPQGGDSNSGSNSSFPLSDALPWKVTASVAGSTHTLRCDVDATTNDSNSELFAGITSAAILQSPIVGAGVTAVVLPTELHLIGSLLPEPYIAIIVQYGPNLYRHMYIGNMEKLGVYEGGEIISATNGPGASSSARDYDDGSLRYLFSGRTGHAAANNGGAHVVAAENPYPWLRFTGSGGTTPIASLPTGVVMGGFGDSINDGYIARGRSPFAGQQMLAPINLYWPEKIIGDASFHPLGRPAGVRLVNMQDLQPNAEIIVGGKLWRVFPSHARRFETVMPKSTPSGTVFPEYETSHWVGYAYAVDEEDSNS